MHAPDASHPLLQILWLFVLAIPISSIAWTVTKEEVFREPREFCERCSKTAASLVARKFFYLFTCEYCFSHWVTAFFLVLTRYKLLLDDWRGYVFSLFALVWVANAYMSLYSRLRVDIHSEKAATKTKEVEREKLEEEIKAVRGDGR
jgi:hypothetical protein